MKTYYKKINPQNIKHRTSEKKRKNVKRNFPLREF